MAEETEKYNVKIQYDTNADEASKDVGNLEASMEGVTAAQDKNAKSTKKLDEANKSFKTQLREANELLKKQVQIYGETSKEAVEAAKKVAELKDQMEFARDLVDKFNPDQKFKALGAATQIAATGTSALVSGYALLGDTSEETEKMLLKVQAAMAFSESISGLSNLGDQWTLFKTTVMNGYNAILAAKKKELVATEAQTVAQRIQNLVAMANPYLAVAAAIVAVSIVTVAWIQHSKEAEKAQKALGDAVSSNTQKTEALKTAISQYNDDMESINNFEVLRARSLGKTDVEIQKIIKSQKELNRQTAFGNENTTYENLLKAQENQSKAFKLGEDEIIKSATEAKEKAYELWREAAKEKSKSIDEQQMYELEVTIENNKKREDAERAAYEKAKQIRDAIKEERKRNLEELRSAEKKALEDIQNINDKTDQEKLDRQKERDLAEIEALKQKGVDVSNLLIYNSEKYFTLQNELDEKQKADKAQKDKEAADAQLEIDKENAEKKLEIERAILEQKQAIQDSQVLIADKAVGFLSTIAGKNKTLQKAAIITENAVGIGKSLIANAAGNAAATAQGAALGVTDPSAPIRAAALVVNNNIATGIGVASSIAATAKALSAIGGGGAGSSGGSGAKVGAAPGAAGGSAAPQVGFQTSSENQIAEGVSNKFGDLPPVKAFVLESEMTSVQNKVAGKLQSNSLG